MSISTKGTSEQPQRQQERHHRKQRLHWQQLGPVSTFFAALLVVLAAFSADAVAPKDETASPSLAGRRPRISQRRKHLVERVAKEVTSASNALIERSDVSDLKCASAKTAGGKQTCSSTDKVFRVNVSAVGEYVQANFANDKTLSKDHDIYLINCWTKYWNEAGSKSDEGQPVSNRPPEKYGKAVLCSGCMPAGNFTTGDPKQRCMREAEFTQKSMPTTGYCELPGPEPIKFDLQTGKVTFEGSLNPQYWEDLKVAARADAEKALEAPAEAA